MTEKAFKETANILCNSTLQFPQIAQELSLLGSFSHSEAVSKMPETQYTQTWDNSADRLISSLKERVDAPAQQVISQLKAEKDIKGSSPDLLSGTHPIN